MIKLNLEWLGEDIGIDIENPPNLILNGRMRYSILVSNGSDHAVDGLALMCRVPGKEKATSELVALSILRCNGRGDCGFSRTSATIDPADCAVVT